jgi:hypothetical protein
MDYETKRKRREQRDARAIELLELRGVAVGQWLTRFINQADRECLVFAVNGTRYAFSYEMPAGGIYRQIGDTRTGRERSVSLARLPQWAQVEEK